MEGFRLFILVIVVFLQLPLYCNCTASLTRPKRGLLDMVVTLWCYRNKLKVPLLGINMYGCYCGTGGSGSPVDPVDHCCFLHDCCYRYSRVSLECHSKVKWEFYRFSCTRARTECISTSLCGRMACECDKQFAECLTKVKPRAKHFFYNKKDNCSGLNDICPHGYPNVTEISRWTHSPSDKQVVTRVSRMRKSNTKQKIQRNRTKIRRIRDLGDKKI